MIRNEKFDAILDAEDAVRTDYALASMGSDLDTRYRANERIGKALETQRALLNELTDEDFAAFVAYRRADRIERGLPIAS